MRLARQLLCALSLMSIAAPVLAWVYPEHRDITVLSVVSLDAERRAIFESLWREARSGREERLCEKAADAGQGLMPDCIDWAAMPAIGGDHSCSAREMLETVSNDKWILSVARIAAELKVDLSRIESAPTAQSVSAGFLESEAIRARRVNALQVADTHLLRADPDYATRAGSNNAHFLLARPRTDFSAKEYIELTLRDGSEINAVGVFEWYHLSALQKATRLARETLSAEERSSLVMAMLVDEAFALHFLEDIYAAGHVAGTWGDVSQRRGTHDYYNQHGLEVVTWGGGSTTAVLMGDAHMRPEDAERVAEAVRTSLEALIDTAAARPMQTILPHAPQAPSEPDAFDVCKASTLPQRPAGLHSTPEAVQLSIDVLQATPVPGLGEGLGAMPRFRAEVGPFIGVAGSLDTRFVDGGFTGLEEGNGFVAGADLSLRAGLGVNGVLGEAGDGLVFLSLGYRGDSPSTNDFTDTLVAQRGGTLSAAIPARSGYSARLRMPFYLVPGDLLLLAPLHFVVPRTYQHIAVTAANGGRIPWQVGLATRFGRFQFVLGREIGVAFYGVHNNDRLLAPGTSADADIRVIRFRSTYLDLPVLEYRPYRSFDTTQTSELTLELYAGMDIPRGGDVIAPPGAPRVDLERTYSIGVRAVFDWRHYF